MVTHSLMVNGDPKCSTPFGITEVGIQARDVTPRNRSAVLNAFRHHRGGHQFPKPLVPLLYGVLNAFRHHRGGHNWYPLIA